MAKRIYTLEDQQEFIEVAQEMGVGPAMRSMGYPESHHTAKKWFTVRNLAIPHVDTLKQEASNLKAFYLDRDKVFAAQKIIERIVEKIEQTVNLTADDINKLANAMHRAIQTINLVEGKATVVQDQVSRDGTDLAIQDLISKAKAQNALKEAAITGNSSE